MRAYHNTRKSEYRSPFGALESGGSVFLALDVFDAPNAVCRCRVWIDGKGESITPMQLLEKDGFLRFSCTLTPAEPALLWYSFIIENGGETRFLGAKSGAVGGEGELYSYEPPSFQITVYQRRNVPDWYKNGIVYQIFPDSFCRGENWRGLADKALSSRKNGIARALYESWNASPRYQKDDQGRVIRWDFFGGTLSGIIEKLPYLKSMGITVIYLNPIFEASSCHRYDTGDYLKIDSMLGNCGDFERLAKEAEKSGISIILDGVFNHTGCDSRYFNKYGSYPEVGAYQHPESPYRGWYNFRPDGGYTSWWGVDDLPDTNKADPSYRGFIYQSRGSVVRRWLKAGARGWRLDVADELPDDFIAGIKSAVTETLGGEGLLLGEVWEDASNKISYGKLRRYFLGGELDSVMNYPFRDVMIGFVTGHIPAGEVCERLDSLFENYPPEAFYSTLNLLGSHDRPRILTVLGESADPASLSEEQRASFRLDEWQLSLAKARLWLLVLIQMTFPGVPCVYYGDEAGLQGFSDPYNRAAFPWGREDGDTAAIYRHAISLRKLLPAFTGGGFGTLCCDDDVFGITRTAENEAATVLINRARCEKTIHIPRVMQNAREVLSGARLESTEREITLTLSALGSAVVYFDNGEKLCAPLPRGCGVLCHITSLPNRKGRGNIGAPAREFIDMLAECGQRYWQMLPVNPTDEFNSPYAGTSAFAGAAALLETGEKTLSQLYSDFIPDDGYELFCRENEYWLSPYCAFMAIKKLYPAAWQSWPQKYRRYNDALLKSAELIGGVDFYRFCQYEFSRQWSALKKYAAEKGVLLIGDMPMYVSEDSADVWAFPELFCLDCDGHRSAEAGVPPDYFSKDGQLWGDPLYNWDAMRSDGYKWWIKRLSRAFGLFDYVRLDHFRGFEAYWAVENGKAATEGRWLPGPGTELFKAAHKTLGSLPIIAEDLGVITSGVRMLRAICGFCGMDVIQFYDGDVRNSYEPSCDSIAYTGTHDNQTLLSWCSDTFPDENAAELAKQLKLKALCSDARAVILPLQDILGLDDSARMNTPGVAAGNWSWQAPCDGLCEAMRKHLDLCRQSGRI